MFIPSEAVQQQMNCALAGLWIDKAMAESMPVLIIKLPTHVIKAIHRGVGAVLIVAVARVDGIDVRCVGLKICDDVLHPFITFRTHRNADEHDLLFQLLGMNAIPCHFFDELSRPLMTCTCRPETGPAAELRYLSDSRNHYVGERCAITELALDAFAESIEHGLGADMSALPEKLAVHLRFEDHRPIQIYAVGSGKFKLDDRDEGGGLEQSAHQLLESLFPSAHYRSPLVEDGQHWRELTDSIGICDLAVCLVESKALSMYNTDLGSLTERRVSQIKKDIDKGLRQIQGAVRKIRSSATIFRRNPSAMSQPGQPILIPDRQRIAVIGVVLISEMHPDLDWRGIAATVRESSKNNLLLHVLDLAEMREVVGRCGAPERFVVTMVKRAMIIAHTGNALMRNKPGAPAVDDILGEQ